MKIVFFGSDDFAAEYLKGLIRSEHQVAACVTQPDRPKGRGMDVGFSPIKEIAMEHHLPLLQPVSLKEGPWARELKKFQGDIFVVIAYGQFLPGNILNIPPLGAVNVHASLLPKYRGAAPIHWAVMSGEIETGISIIRINEQMDAGDILAVSRMAIGPEETALAVRRRMMDEGPAFLVHVLSDLQRKAVTAVAQDHANASFAPKLTKELGRVAWTRPAAEIHNLARGLLPWPTAYTQFQGKILKILDTRVVDVPLAKAAPGSVLDIGKEGIIVATGLKALLLKRVHLQDGKPMDAHSFVVGHPIKIGSTFQ